MQFTPQVTEFQNSKTTIPNLGEEPVCVELTARTEEILDVPFREKNPCYFYKGERY